MAVHHSYQIILKPLGLSRPSTTTRAPPPPKVPTSPYFPIMQQVMITEFSGSHKDMTQPSEFLKIVGRSLMGPGQVAMDDQIEAACCWLKTGSPAKTWFNKTPTPKTKYANFAQAFKTEFKDVEKAEKSAPELEREISEMRIKTEDLGRSEKYRGQDMYTHIIFAEKILDLAKRAKIDNTTSGLFNVRDKLPEVLREKVHEDQASWMAFADAIKKV